MTRVIITGSSGFIGSHLCLTLVQRDYAVTGIDISTTGNKESNGFEVQQTDLTTSPELPEADVIVHLAAHSQVQSVVRNSKYATENIEMTRHILEEANRMDASVIYASSRDVYGSAIQPAEDSVSPKSPNMYAASKLGSEAILNAFSTSRDVPVASIRLSNVYGPGDYNSRVVPTFISLANFGEELPVFGEGKMMDFVFINDVCDALATAIQRIDAVSGEVINVGSGTGTPLTLLADEIASEISTCPGWTTNSERAGDVSRYVSDISKAGALLDFEPSVDLSTGISSTIDWYMNRQDLLASLRPTHDGADAE